MRLQEIIINSYGPLASRTISDIGDFTLVFGENESGKTLLLDAIIRIMLHGERKINLFGGINRVEHNPNGHIKIQHEGKFFRLPDDGSLPQLINLPPEDFRNVFVVRASKLGLHDEEGIEYFAELTDRFLGVHREPIKKTINELLKIGHLTPSGKLSDSVNHNQIFSRVKRAKELIEKIDNLLLNSKDEFGKNEAEYTICKERLEEIVFETNSLNSAKMRNRYLTNKELLSQLKKDGKELGGKEFINQITYNDWNAFDAKSKGTENNIKRTQLALDSSNKDLESALKKQEVKVGILTNLESRRDMVEELSDDAFDFREAHLSSKSFQPISEILPKGITAIGLIFVLTLIGLLTRTPNLVFTIFSLITGFMLVALSIALLVDRLRTGKQTEAWDSLIIRSKEIGLEAEDIGSLLELLRKFKQDLEHARDEKIREEANIESMQKTIREDSRSIQEFNSDYEENVQQMNELKRKTGVKKLTTLQKRINEKKEIEKRQNDNYTILAERFDVEIDTKRDNYEELEKEIEKLSNYENISPEISYDIATEEKLLIESSDIDSRIKELEELLSSTKNERNVIGRDVNSILAPVQSFPCETVEDLEKIQLDLEDFVKSSEDLAFIANSCIRVLEAVKKDEEEKISELFTESDIASHYFSIFTQGKYKAVEYDTDEGELKAKRNDGKIISSSKLSSGATHQLYMATRLSLAKRILSGKTGFLLLDDPFLTSDTPRLKEQLKVLLDLAKEGWQIIYFSVKDEIKDILSEEIKAKKIDLVELQPLP